MAEVVMVIDVSDRQLLGEIVAGSRAGIGGWQKFMRSRVLRKLS